MGLTFNLNVYIFFIEIYFFLEKGVLMWKTFLLTAFAANYVFFVENAEAFQTNW